jgi:hypothetical protein
MYPKVFFNANFSKKQLKLNNQLRLYYICLSLSLKNFFTKDAMASITATINLQIKHSICLK